MPVFYDEQTKTFFLEGKNLSYVFGINAAGFPEHYYFGSRIGRDDLRYALGVGGNSAEACVPGMTDSGRNSYNNYGAEISSYGSGDYHECSLQILFPNGCRLNEFRYHSHRILEKKPGIPGMPSLQGGTTLLLTVKDKNSEVYVDLYYTVYEDIAVLCRHMEVHNRTGKTISLLRAYSFTLELPRNDYDVLTLEGAWADERTPQRIPMHHGVVSIDSKTGSSSARLNPFMAVLDRNTDEYNGNAIGLNLVYSGSYVLKAEVGSKGSARIMGGINDFDFQWQLCDGETFATPEVVMVYSDCGLNAMSRTFHDAYRRYLINPRFVMKHRPVVINNWEATYFNFDNERLMGIIDVVKGSGIDTFVLDDGWFGARAADNAGLGDWIVNTEKLKGGLHTVIEYCHQSGMKFGLWFEPEMVNPDSNLYRAHPDWAIHMPGMEPALSRNQMVLDITRTEVRDYIVESVSKILRENDIDYVKWDFNRVLTENYSIALPPERQQEFHHRYALGLYDLCERLVNGFPSVFFEGCAGGGARFDPAMLHYFPQIWTSDDTDAYMRTRIQYGTSYCYPLSSMSCHTSICPNHQTGRTTPFTTRADIAHLGATGYELDTTKMTKEEVAEVADQIRAYHEMEDLILDGELFRLEDPHVSNYFAVTVVSRDKTEAHITAFRTLCYPNDEVKRIYPRGLCEETRYFIRELGITLSGATIMKMGLLLPNTTTDFKTFVFHLKKEDSAH